ncbi:S-layer homology domain-containing protein, partial [Leptospira santarosai]|nr:S-layer homology domain-containing protein [Leptospira santarosai]
MIAKALGGSPTGTYTNAGFTDVPADRQWAVNFLVEKDIVSGKAAGKFGANDFTTRGEMAKIIANAYKFVGDASNTFPFTDVSETFKQYVDALNEAGVAQGYAGTTQFGTGDLVTRGQFALFVFRAETFSPETAAVVSVSATNLKEVVVNLDSA